MENSKNKMEAVHLVQMDVDTAKIVNGVLNVRIHFTQDQTENAKLVKITVEPAQTIILVMTALKGKSGLKVNVFTNVQKAMVKVVMQKCLIALNVNMDAVLVMKKVSASNALMVWFY